MLTDFPCHSFVNVFLLKNSSERREMLKKKRKTKYCKNKLNYSNSLNKNSHQKLRQHQVNVTNFLYTTAKNYIESENSFNRTEI